MEIHGWLELALFVALLAALTKPTGIWLCKVLDPGERTLLDPVLRPVERGFLRLMGVDPSAEQDWKRYAFSLLLFSLAGALLTYGLLRFQDRLPLNPQAFAAVNDHLAFNTAISFLTNTNWQFYGGESTMSYLSQMLALAIHNFTSAACGIAVAAALVRGIARSSAKTVGNFWVDLVRLHLYLLLPLSFVFSLFLVSQGMIQNFDRYAVARTLDNGATQTIVQGPMASQVAIKMLGTNGGGYTNANAAHPFENPTPLSNFVQMLSIFLIPAGLTWYFGRAVRHQRHGWAVFCAMLVLFLAGVLLCWGAEARGNPRLHALGVSAADGNLEGKEVRFGAFESALFATVTTDASCGAVNAMHDSFTPLGGLVPLLNIQLGEVIFGGVGAGLYGMIVFTVLTVFLAGLMVGRTPEYLGKKIEAADIKIAVIAIMVPIFGILGFTAWAVSSRWGLAGLSNAGPHGFSEILYAFSSAAGNNGSAFAGLSGNGYWWDTTMAVAMTVGRFLFIVPVLALAGSLGRKKLVPESAGSFPVSGPMFVVLLVGTVLIVGALTFFPALSLGPIVEHFLMAGSAVRF
jgi:K+-transporting ATPase ATPase A chain